MSWASQLPRHIGWSWVATISACTWPGFKSKRPKMQHWFHLKIFQDQKASKPFKTRLFARVNMKIAGISYDFFMLLPLKIGTRDRKTHPQGPHIRMSASNGSNLSMACHRRCRVPAAVLPTFDGSTCQDPTIKPLLFTSKQLIFFMKVHPLTNCTLW